MIRFLVGTVINAIGLWVVTLCIPAIKLNPYGGTDFWSIAGSFLVVGAVFGLVSAIVAKLSLSSRM